MDHGLSLVADKRWAGNAGAQVTGWQLRGPCDVQGLRSLLRTWAALCVQNESEHLSAH